MNNVKISLGRTFITTLLGGGVSLMITGGLIYKDVPVVGDRLLDGGGYMIMFGIGWYFIRMVINIALSD